MIILTNTKKIIKKIFNNKKHYASIGIILLFLISSLILSQCNSQSNKENADIKETVRRKILADDNSILAETVIEDSIKKRIYPHNSSRTIGYVLDNDSAIVGLERAYNNVLSKGTDIVTTINKDIQNIAEKSLLEQLQKYDTEYGTVVVMEVETGEIKAIVNLGINENGEYSEIYNYAISQNIEPGSLFKLASLMVALDEGRINLKDSVETGNGTVKYYDLTMRDTKPHGKITVQEAFEISSNVGVSKIIVKAYKDNPINFVDKLYRMNLNDKLNLEIKGEGKPLIKYPGDSLWSGVTLPQMSIGYEVSLTPMQILTFYNAVANNGKMVRPIFVKYLCHHGNTTKMFETEIINPSVCSYETIKKVKIMLEGVVERGTAKNLKNRNYKIAGKTGTAQIAKTKHGYGAKKSYLASFVGYFPADNPQYSCIVVINLSKKEGYYGDFVPAPVFKEIADFIMKEEMNEINR